jgi:hypothetical protein
VREGDTQKLILDWLRLHRILHWRQNVGMMAIGGRFVKFGRPGLPDIIAVHGGRCYGIEVKALKGKQYLLQHDFQLDFTEAGGIYLLCRSLEDVMEGMR